MVNNRGFLRIVEAVIAIMIILGVVVVMSVRNSNQEETDLTSKIAPYLDEIAKDSTWRTRIVSVEVGGISTLEEEINNEWLADRIQNPNIGHAVRICDPPDEQCPLEPYPEEASTGLFAGERIVSSTIPQYAPKKVKIFLWVRD